MYSLEEIAKHIKAELRGDPGCLINRAEPLATAKPGAISFLANAQYQSFLPVTQASAVILRANDADKCSTNALIVSHPELAFSKLLHFLYQQEPVTAGIHPTAVIGQGCQIDSTAKIGPYCVLEDQVQIGPRTVLGSHVALGKSSQVGADCHLYSRVSIYHRVIIGDKVIIHSGAVIGADGFGLTHDGEQWIKIPQIGGVIIGDDVEIGANTTIDRGALQNTEIGKGVKIDNLVQIAHNDKIGDHTAIAGCTAIAGSTEIGQHCMIGGSAAINGHIKITDGVILTGTAAVGQSITEPGIYSSGVGIQKNSLWRRNMVRFHQLDDMAKRLRRLEKKLSEEEASHGQ